MRHLILAALSLGLAQPSAAAWTLINRTSAGAATTGAASVTTTALNMTGADTIFVSVTLFNQNPATSCTVTDSIGTNTWFLAASTYVSGSEANLGLYYAYNAHVGPAMSATVTCGAATYAAMTFWGFSGGLIASDPRDAASIHVATVSSGQTHFQPGSAGAVSGELSITVIAVGGSSGGIASVDSGFSLIGSVNYASGLSEANGAAYTVSTGLALNPTWTITPGNSASAITASFRAANQTASATTPAVVF